LLGYFISSLTYPKLAWFEVNTERIQEREVEMAVKEIIQIEKEIDQLWEEVFKMREETGICQSSPQKEEAIRLMHKLAHRSEEGKRYFQRKRVEIRLRLAKMDCREGKYASALLQIAKGFHLCEEINDEDLLNELRMVERQINEIQKVRRSANG